MGAKQKGIVKIHKGSLGDNTFSNTKYGFTVKPKKRESTSRANAANWAGSRDNAKEFGESSSCARLIRLSVSTIRNRTTDSTAMLRLTSLMSKIIMLDHNGLKGSRKPTNVNLKLLAGFSMNSAVSLRTVFNARFRINADRSAGLYTLNIPAFVPSDCIVMPKTATHFNIVSTVSAIDFSSKRKENIYTESARIELNNTPTADTALEHQLKPATVFPVFVFLGIRFWSNDGSEFFEVSNRKLDPIDIVDVIVE